jgi:hypothetical protein
MRYQYKARSTILHLTISTTDFYLKVGSRIRDFVTISPTDFHLKCVFGWGILKIQGILKTRQFN